MNNYSLLLKMYKFVIFALFGLLARADTETANDASLSSLSSKQQIKDLMESFDIEALESEIKEKV